MKIGNLSPDDIFIFKDEYYIIINTQEAALILAYNINRNSLAYFTTLVEVIPDNSVFFKVCEKYSDE